MQGVEHLGPRGCASTMLGLANFLSVEPNAGHIRAALGRLAQKLVNLYQREVSPEAKGRGEGGQAAMQEPRREGEPAADDWRWFEPELTYDNALIPLALFRAYQVTGERISLRVARESLEFLESICFQDGQLILVGNAGWHRRGGVRALVDEQATDAAAFVLAFRGAYLVTGDHHYLQRMRESFAWFLGANRLGLPLYDFVTAGCRDGLGAKEVNQNQGAESTVSFLMSLLEMQDLAGEGLEHPRNPPWATN